MAQQATRVLIDLSQLPNRSNGTGAMPKKPGWTQVPARTLLDEMTKEFNQDPIFTRRWATEIEFIGGLPPGYSEWTHDTDGRGTVIPEFYGHPVKLIRSKRKFKHHVAEHMAANEAAIRAKIAAVQPNNARNNKRISEGAGNPAIQCVCNP